MFIANSTYKLLLRKATNQLPAEEWVDWAIEMIEHGHKGEYLYILAGLQRPFHSSEVDPIVSQALNEVGIHVPEIDVAIDEYAYVLISLALSGKKTFEEAIQELKDLYDDYDMHKTLVDFHLLYWAKEDLKESEHQWYRPGANQSNLDEIIQTTFKEWQQKHRPLLRDSA